MACAPGSLSHKSREPVWGEEKKSDNTLSPNFCFSHLEIEPDERTTLNEQTIAIYRLWQVHKRDAGVVAARTMSARQVLVVGTWLQRKKD